MKWTTAIAFLGLTIWAAFDEGIWHPPLWLLYLVMSGLWTMSAIADAEIKMLEKKLGDEA
ncbi:hypothetical protein [Hyphomonas sp. CY54-11-8]|uniref:hypothetical protein n=1 Tax=Hyphomonas sp. CY54-11-8 TaxID=1280944 RepID=UPI000458CAD9|nr:hypothetical protein [Hyphomonas sp. CY54-11-8]KCZ47757.1 hypothetical protein HY17_04580 [Hyphomonas sp. CY54-11-8]